jgi:hypothetical protein
MSNCRDHCKHSNLCKRNYPDFNGSEEKYFHFECPMYDKFEDILMETRDRMRDKTFYDDGREET